MGFAATLLDNYKKARNLGSDGRVAEELEVTRQTVSQWRSGTAYPDEEKIASLAIGAGADPGGWLNAIRAERCTGPAALAYRKIARSFGIAATLCLAVYTSIIPSTGSSQTLHSERDAVGSSDFTYHATDYALRTFKAPENFRNFVGAR